MKLILLLLAFCATLHAQENVVDARVSNTSGVSTSAVSATGNVSAAKFVGDGSLLTGVSAGTSSPSWYAVQNVPTPLQNISTGLIVSVTTHNGQYASFTTINGTLSTAAQPNITSVGTLTGLTVSGNAALSVVSASTVSATTANVVTLNANVGNIGSIVGNGVSITNLVAPSARLSERDPTYFDDINSGYTPSDTWVNFKDKRVWQNVDATSGSAIWEALPWWDGPIIDVTSATSTKPCQVAMGVIKLKQSYSSNLLNITRESDSATTSVTMVSGTNKLDVASVAAFCGASGCKVNKGFDQCGSNDMSQTTAAMRPWLNLSNVDAMPALTIDGPRHMTDSANSPRMATTGGSYNQASSTFILIGSVFGNNAVAGIAEEGFPVNVFNIYSNYGTQFTPGFVSGSLWNWYSHPAVNIVMHGPSATTLISNDKALTVSNTFSSELTATGLNVGTNSAFGGFPGNADIYAVIGFNGKLTAAELLRLKVSAYINFGIVPQVRQHLVAIGDSIPYGWGSESNTIALRVARNMAVQNLGAYNQAIPGSHCYDLGTIGALFTNQLQASHTYDFLTTFCRNDITEGQTAASVYTSLTAMLGNIRSSMTTVGANGKVFISTIAPTSGTTAGTEAQRNALNVLIRANSAGFDGVADAASNTVLGGVNAVSRTDLFGDGVHETARAQSIMGMLWTKLLRSVIR